jgi:5-methylcytosine-specific restriction enzyme A
MSGKLTRLKPRLQPIQVRRSAALTMLEVPRRAGQWLMDERRRLFSHAPLCVGYKAGSNHVAAAIARDHIVPLWEGGEDVESNTQGLCDECHVRKSTDEAARRGAHR